MQARDKRRVLLARLAPYARFRNPHPQEVQLPLDLAYVGGLFDRLGWEIHVRDGWLEPELGRGSVSVEEYRGFDVAVIVAEALNVEGALGLAGALEAAEVACVVAIGQMAIELPEILLGPGAGFDVCVTGEPEAILPSLVDVFFAGGDLNAVRGLAFRDGAGELVLTPPAELVADPDELAPPAYGVFDLDAYAKQSCHAPVFGGVRWGWLLTSRGCSANCEFCSPVLRKSIGARWRAHSDEYVLRLVDQLQYEHGCNAIAIEDDHFVQSSERTLSLCEALARRPRRLPWTAQARIDHVDAGLARAMARAGCTGLCIGIESATEAFRRRYKHCTISTAEIEERVAAVHAAGMHTTLYFMLGFPGESLAQMEETLALAQRLAPLMIQVAFYTPYPGSSAWKRIAGSVSSDELSALSHYNAVRASAGSVPPEELRDFQSRFYRSFYLRPRYLLRYATRRLPYTLVQGRELSLAARTLTWMLRRRLGRN